MINFKTVKKYRKHEKIKNPASPYSKVLLHLYYRMKTEKRYKELRAKKVLLAVASGISLPMRDVHTQMHAHAQKIKT